MKLDVELARRLRSDQVGLMQVTVSINRDVWRKVVAKSRELECSPGLVIAAGLEALDAQNP